MTDPIKELCDYAAWQWEGRYCSLVNFETPHEDVRSIVARYMASQHPAVPVAFGRSKVDWATVLTVTI